MSGSVLLSVGTSSGALIDSSRSFELLVTALRGVAADDLGTFLVGGSQQSFSVSESAPVASLNFIHTDDSCCFANRNCFCGQDLLALNVTVCLVQSNSNYGTYYYVQTTRSDQYHLSQRICRVNNTQNCSALCFGTPDDAPDSGS